MPIMTRMRDNMPVILFGLLIAFLVMIVFEWGMDYLGIRSGRPEDIGTVNGKPISYKEFSEILKNYTDAQRAQGGQDPDENQLKQIREQVWQGLVTQRLVEEEVERLGIAVTDQELINWVHGDNPPEDLRRFFTDSTGQFRRDLYEQFLRDPNQFLRDPEGSDASYGSKWLTQYENSLRQRKLQEKLQSLMMASVRITEGELRQRYADQNLTYSALYCLFDASAVKDEEVQVTDADLREYYNQNLEQFRVEAERNITYVVLPEKPSTSDSLMVLKEIDDIAAKAREGVDFIELVYTYSPRPDSGAFFRRGELSPELEEVAFSTPLGSVVGPVSDKDGAHLLKVLAERKSESEFVRASHILVPVASADSATSRKLADSLFRAVRGGADFANIARAFSKDPGSAQRGGDLGWFTKGRMVPPFETAVLKARIGEIVGPVRTQFGYHIIKKTGRDTRDLKIAHIDLKIETSPQTRNDLFERARDFAYNAREGGFAKEAEQMGFQVRDVRVQEKGGVIPGIGVEEGMVRWIFANEAGSISEPFSVTSGYAVVSITGAREGGIRPFDEVKENLKPLTLRKKKIEKTMQRAADIRLRLAQGDSLSRVTQLDPGVQVRSAGPFTMSSSVPGVGREGAFLGAVSALAVGAISPPVETSRGAYLIQLQSRSEIDSADYASQQESLRSRLLQEKKNTFLSQWLDQLRKNADIEDYRDLYYR